MAESPVTTSTFGQRDKRFRAAAALSSFNSMVLTTAVVGWWKDSVVMIDDFEVPFDRGYGFENYGPGKRLCYELDANLLPAVARLYFPSLRALRIAAKRVSKNQDLSGQREGGWIHFWCAATPAATNSVSCSAA